MNKNEIYCDSCNNYFAADEMSVVVYTDTNIGGDYCEECLADATDMEEISASWSFATA